MTLILYDPGGKLALSSGKESDQYPVLSLKFPSAHKSIKSVLEIAQTYLIVQAGFDEVNAAMNSVVSEYEMSIGSVWVGTDIVAVSQ